MLALRLAARGGLAERSGAAFEQAFAVVRRIGNDMARDQDPERHAAPAGVVNDAFVAAMLRAAELPAIRSQDLARVLLPCRRR